MDKIILYLIIVFVLFWAIERLYKAVIKRQEYFEHQQFKMPDDDRFK